jgi:hypothetical protein
VPTNYGRLYYNLQNTFVQLVGINITINITTCEPWVRKMLIGLILKKLKIKHSSLNGGKTIDDITLPNLVSPN